MKKNKPCCEGNAILRNIRDILIENHGGNKQDLTIEIITINELIKKCPFTELHEKRHFDREFFMDTNVNKDSVFNYNSPYFNGDYDNKEANEYLKSIKGQLKLQI